MTGLLILSVLLNIYALSLIKKHRINLSLKIAASIIIFICFQLYLLRQVAIYFNGTGINEAVIYHLHPDLLHSGFLQYRELVFSAAIYIVLTVLLVGYVFSSGTKAPGTSKRLRSRRLVVPVMAGLLINPASFDLYHLYSNHVPGHKDTPPFSGVYRLPSPTPTDSGRDLPNIVFIYLESIERTYFDNELYPGLIEYLNNIEKESTTFTGLVQYPLTGWTIAGMTASQCGLPLVTSSNGNRMGGTDLFLPGARCLGDVLGDTGYSLAYLGGASLEFAGKKQFFQTHGFTDVAGYPELLPLLEDHDYLTHWGLYDDTLFRIAENKLEDLSEHSQPFLLALLTLDTHLGGHPSRSCDGIKYKDGKNTLLNAVKCTDLLASRFIRNIRASEYGDNTIIIVASDHMAMRNNELEKLPKGERTNLFFMNFPDNSGHYEITKSGSTLDIGATILDVLEFENPDLGFGRSLLSDRITLVELGLDKKDIQSYRPDINRLWQFPSISSGLLIDDISGRIRLGSRIIRAPSLIHLEEDGTVTDIIFGHKDDKLSEKLNDYKPGVRFLLVDYCLNIDNPFSPPVHEDNETFCIVGGQTASNGLFLQKVDDEAYLSFTQILDVINNQNPATRARPEETMQRPDY